MSEDKLTLNEQLAYGLGDFASCLYWQTFMKYLPFYYTDIFGISAAALGGLLLFSRVLNGLSDPWVGMWADRTHTRWGKFRPFVLLGALPLGIFGALTFTTPALSPGWKLLWAYLTYNCLMVLYTVVNIPYSAMLGVLTSDAGERTRLSSIKFMFAFAAGMVISATLLPMAHYLGDSGANPARGWQLSFVVVGVVAALLFGVTFLGTRERIRPTTNINQSVLGDLRGLFSNEAWLWLLATTFTFILYVATRSSVFAHYFKYCVYEGKPDVPRLLFGRPMAFDALVSTFNTVGQAVAVLGVLLTASFAQKLPKRRLFVAGFGLAILATASFFFIPPSELGWLLVVDALGAFVSAPLNVLLWAMYADAADYAEWKAGRRTTGLVFSASTMGQKMGWAVGGYAAFALLSSVGFQANIAPSLEVRASLVWLMSLVPAVLGLVSLGCFAFYPLSDEKVAVMTLELKARRAVASSVADGAGG
jgi:glycoside/pentoside/hexuronide:cation symporter, GPH family